MVVRTSTGGSFFRRVAPLYVPAAISAPVSGRSPASVVLGPVTSALRPASSVRTPSAVLPLSGKFHFMLIAVATVAVALLPVVVVAVPSFRRPPVVHGLLVLVLPPVPEAVVWFERAGALSVPRVEGWRRERRVGRMGVVHGVWRVVAHRLRSYGGRHGWVW